jgi:hypothetical protein
VRGLGYGQFVASVFHERFGARAPNPGAREEALVCDVCDGAGQVWHGSGALTYVTLCPNGCALRAWDES